MENKQNFDEMVTRSQKIRALYHKLELLCRNKVAGQKGKIRSLNWSINQANVCGGYLLSNNL